MSGLLFDMLEDRDGDYEGIEIPLPSISEENIKHIIKYCEHFNFECKRVLNYPLKSSNLRDVLPDEWEVDFIRGFDLNQTLMLL